MLYHKALMLAWCVLSLVACQRNDERFLNTYTDILLVRMTETDSAVAQQKVAATLARYGYTETEFRREFFDRAKDPQQLRTMIDSARRRAEQRLSEMKTHQR